MDKNIMAFILLALAFLAVAIPTAIGSLAWEVGGPIITLIVGATIGYLFPSPLS
jgi:hypothetical protein